MRIKLYRFRMDASELHNLWYAGVLNSMLSILSNDDRFMWVVWTLCNGPGKLLAYAYLAPQVKSCWCHCVGGGAPVNFGRRWRAACQKKSWAAQKKFSRNPEISFYNLKNVLMTFFSHQKNNTPKIALTSRQQNICGGTPITKSRRRRRPQIGRAARPAQGSSLGTFST